MKQRLDRLAEILGAASVVLMELWEKLGVQSLVRSKGFGEHSGLSVHHMRVKLSSIRGLEIEQGSRHSP